MVTSVPEGYLILLGVCKELADKNAITKKSEIVEWKINARKLERHCKVFSDIRTAVGRMFMVLRLLDWKHFFKGAALSELQGSFV